ncbi:MAG TPA: dihydrofolate reductase [Lunatimonas sp.]|nr:dihydrofolate reductase [Lunatimonas sp.]
MVKSIIVAKATNNAIGVNNNLPWHLPSDLKHFKQTTSGHHVIMGRKTFESLGKPLPGRTHIILTRNESFRAPKGHYVVHSLEEAFDIGKSKNLDKIFILGGAEIYGMALPFTDELIITEVHANPEADTFFPPIDPDQWVEKSRERIDKKNTADEFDLDFVVYHRKN